VTAAGNSLVSFGIKSEIYRTEIGASAGSALMFDDLHAGTVAGRGGRGAFARRLIVVASDQRASGGAISAGRWPKPKENQ
jgi:hypothetical protein